MVTGIAALLLAILPSPRKRHENWRWLLAFVAGLGAAFTISLSAHAVVIPQSAWAQFLDWAHLVVMSVWIGGLLPLVLTIRRIRLADAGRHLYFDLAPGVAGRFSTFALGALIFMAVTGIVQAFLRSGGSAFSSRLPTAGPSLRSSRSSRCCSASARCIVAGA